MMAAGTHAMEGSDWRPVSTGPMAALTSFTRATTRPSGVPTATAMKKPRMPRETLVQMYSNSVPWRHISANSSPTSSGLGSR